ncbi:MAG: N-acetylmuramoyl-L-alanine amidase-like domain-containing protein [Candidatus Sericytochromatia bacterium]
MRPFYQACLGLLLLAGPVGLLSGGPVLPVAQAKSVAKPQLKSLAQMSEAEIDLWLKSHKGQSFVQRIEAVSERALGTPYFLGPLGEGPSAPYDQKPLVDLKRVDCVTFCEQTLALALSSSYKQAVQTLQKIRYDKGEVKMECRNHYFMADWIPHNAWLVKDISAQLPGAHKLTRTISHQNLFASQGFKGIQVRQKDRTLSISYIPEDQLEKALPHLQSGDVGVLIQDLPGIFAAHTGLVIKKGDKLFLRNATSLEPRQVVDTPFADLIVSLKKSKRLIGMSFARPHAQPKP